MVSISILLLSTPMFNNSFPYATTALYVLCRLITLILMYFNNKSSLETLPSLLLCQYLSTPHITPHSPTIPANASNVLIPEFLPVPLNSLYFIFNSDHQRCDISIYYSFFLFQPG